MIRNLQYRRNLRRRIYQQAHRPGLTWVQGATIVAMCSVAAFVAWAAMVLLLALA